MGSLFRLRHRDHGATPHLPITKDHYDVRGRRTGFSSAMPAQRGQGAQPQYCAQRGRAGAPVTGVPVPLIARCQMQQSWSHESWQDHETGCKKSAKEEEDFQRLGVSPLFQRILEYAWGPQRP
jgi:hypothetical protein